MAQPTDAGDLMDFDARWDHAEPAASAAAFHELLPAARAAGEAEYLAQLLSQIARTESLQQRFEEAHAILDEVDSLLSDETPVACVRALLERGRTFNSAKAIEKARPLFARAYQQARAIPHDFHAVDAAHMLEIVSSGEEKLRWNLEACAIAEATSSPRARKWLGSLYNNRGWTLHELGRLDDALAVFEKRLGYLEAHDPREEQLSIARWSIAKTLRLLDRAGEALEIQEALLDSSPDDGYVHEELAECLLALRRSEAARPHFARAHELLKDDPWLARDEAARLERMRRLGGAGGTAAGGGRRAPAHES